MHNSRREIDYRGYNQNGAEGSVLGGGRVVNSN
jgi:hypothetical protein